MARRLAKLKQRCRRAGIPAIYVNDNFGQWRSDGKSLVKNCLASDCAGPPHSPARTRREHEQTIEHIKEMTSASVVASSSLRVRELRRESSKRRSKI
jgi:hypothetical protein